MVKHEGVHRVRRAATLVHLAPFTHSSATEKRMQNSKIESRQRLDSARSRTECTASGEIHGLCAVYTHQCNGKTDEK